MVTPPPSEMAASAPAVAPEPLTEEEIARKEKLAKIEALRAKEVFERQVRGWELGLGLGLGFETGDAGQIGRASCRERVSSPV